MYICGKKISEEENKGHKYSQLEGFPAQRSVTLAGKSYEVLPTTSLVISQQNLNQVQGMSDEELKHM